MSVITAKTLLSIRQSTTTCRSRSRGAGGRFSRTTPFLGKSCRCCCCCLCLCLCLHSTWLQIIPSEQSPAVLCAGGGSQNTAHRKYNSTIRVRVRMSLPGRERERATRLASVLLDVVRFWCTHCHAVVVGQTWTDWLATGWLSLGWLCCLCMLPPLFPTLLPTAASARRLDNFVSFYSFLLLLLWQ